MSEASNKRSGEFLKISGRFKLGGLTTESSHPVTVDLSEVAKNDIAQALDLFFQVDGDVLKKYREFAESGRAGDIKESLLRALKNDGKIFFTGCGSTGRLSIQLVSIWRDFWQRQRARGLVCSPSAEAFENRAFSVMAGGDYALIKSVEGFEDFAAFGKKQLGDLGVSSRDVVFAITEGGETSFVIGTAWKGVEAGAKVYFVYNNPDDVLCKHVERSREVIQEPRIEKINLTTGPMAITGSTRMQATTIQLCVLLTVLEMVLRDLMKEPGRARLLTSPACSPSVSARKNARPPVNLDSAEVPHKFYDGLVQLSSGLRAPEFLEQLAKLVALEESVYRAGRKNNYFADRFGMDVLTDTTERSPTYCTPPFRKFDDAGATESWSFLFLPPAETPRAWERILRRQPRCIEWSDSEVRELVDEQQFRRTRETLRKISSAELMRFKIGLDGAEHRALKGGDTAIGILSGTEEESLLSPDGFFRVQLEAARSAGASVGLIYFGNEDSLKEYCSSRREEPLFENSEIRNPKSEIQGPVTSALTVLVPVPETDFLLDGVTRVAVKLVLNALSTCTMVRLGRVMGNTMIWVVPSNLKLIDRATRCIQKLTGLSYDESNRMLFEVIEYVEPRMKADQAYPPVVGVAVLRIRHKLTNEQAENRLMTEMNPSL